MGAWLGKFAVRRRSFLMAVGGAAAGLAGVPGIRIGVGTFSYHGISMDDMIVRLRQQQIREIEMSRGEFMLMKPPTVQMCSEARAKLDRAGIRCSSYYTATIKMTTTS